MIKMKIKDKSTYVKYYLNGGKKYEVWHKNDYRNDELHRVNKPAWIKYYPEGKIQREEWWENDRLHRIGKPAWILYAKGGKMKRGKVIKEEYWYKGIQIPKEVALKTMPIEEVLTHKNSSVRRAGVELYGGVEVFNGLKDKKLVDSWDKYPAGRVRDFLRKQQAELWEANIDGETFTFLKVICPSENVVDILIECGAKTCLQALAMSAGVSEDEYIKLQYES